MTAPTTIKAETSDPIETLAHTLAAGLPWPEDRLVEYPTHSDEEWIEAAQAGIESGDFTDFELMLDEEAENNREERQLRAREHANYHKPILGRVA